jgi:hypothetical protein
VSSKRMSDEGLQCTGETFVPLGDAIIAITTSNVTGPQCEVDSPDVFRWGALFQLGNAKSLILARKTIGNS